MTEEEIFKLPFDIERHKSAPYHIALEVMISPEGDVAYALPSHQEFLIAKAMEINNWSRDELMEKCPPEYYADFMTWLIPRAGRYVPVWKCGVLRYPLTSKQISALKKLKLAGLYRGYVPKFEMGDRNIKCIF